MESRHGSVLKQRLIARRAELLEAMARGLPNDVYAQTVGQARGIEEAMRMSDDADRELSGE